ncbi:dystroglycan isoform d [Anaeramoeba flamelloides]|uniref:Dystroglycan isoform d n=1 Tax=Anaeramoeba flamelloides TaxID=1746091 RepID=A0AAV7ZD79_9EUKA|nr:dystroglycan isoform d [Anaeramoeba flamelloides]
MNKLFAFLFIASIFSTIYCDSCLSALDDELIVNDDDMYDDKFSSVATLADGTHSVVVWRSSYSSTYNLNIAILDTSDPLVADGERPTHVYEAQQLTTGQAYNTYPDVTPLHDNKFLVMWSGGDDNSNLDIYARVYKYTTGEGFKTLSTETIINTHLLENQEYPTARLVKDENNPDREKVLLVWSSQNQDPSDAGVVASYGVYCQLAEFTDLNNFELLGDEERLNEEIPNSQFKQHMWSHTTDGSVVVVWESANQDSFASGVFGRVIDCTGEEATFKSDEFKINYNTDYNQLQISVSGSHEEGSNLVVFTWASKHDHVGYYSIYYRVMDLDYTQYENGIPKFITEDVLVSQNLNGYSDDMADPMIAFTKGNNVVIIGWTSKDQDYAYNSLTRDYENSDGVYARAYDSSSWQTSGLSVISDEFPIHSGMTFDQSEVRIDAIGDENDIIFTWTSGSAIQKSQIITRLWGFGGVPPVKINDMVTQNLMATVQHTYNVEKIIFEDINDQNLTYTAYESGTDTPVDDWITFNVLAGDYFQFVFDTPAVCSGTYDIEIRAQNECDGYTVAPLTINIENQSPVVPAAVTGQTVDANSLYTYTILDSEYYDNDGDLDYPLTVNLPDFLSFDGSVISGTAPDGCGTDSQSFDIQIIAIDDCDQQSSVTFTVDIINEGPSYNGGLTGKEVTAGQLADPYDISSFFTEPEGGDLTFTFELTDTSKTNPSWNILDENTGVFNWNVPNTQPAETLEIKVIATDACGTSESGNFLLTVINETPEKKITIDTKDLDASYYWTFKIEIGTIVDPEGATITYEAYTIQGEQWWSFDSNSLTFSGTTPKDCRGEYIIGLKGSDPSGQYDETQFNVNVGNNPAPEAIGTINRLEGIANQPFTHTFIMENLFTDDNMDTMTYKVSDFDNENVLNGIDFDGIDTIFNSKLASYCNDVVTYKLWAIDECDSSVNIEFEILFVNYEPTVVDPLSNETYTIDLESVKYYLDTDERTAFEDLNEEELSYEYNLILDDGTRTQAYWVTFQDTSDPVYFDIDLEDLCTASHHFEVIATDKCNKNATSDFWIHTINYEPTIDDQSTLDGHTFTMYKNEDFFVSLANTFNDDEGISGLTLTLEALADNGVDTQDLPYYLDFDSQDQTLQYNGAEISEVCDETHTLIYTITDKCEQTKSVQFEVSFETRPPVVVAPGIEDLEITTFMQSIKVEYGLAFNDPDDEFLETTVYKIVDEEHVSIDTISWITDQRKDEGEPDDYQSNYLDVDLYEQCDGTHDFIVYAEDVCNKTVSETFTITIDNTAPYIMDDAILPSKIIEGEQQLPFYIELGEIFADDDDQATFETYVVEKDSEELPIWLEYNGDDFALSSINSGNDNLPSMCDSEFEMVYYAIDRCGNKASYEFTLNIVNKAPTMDHDIEDITVNAVDLEYIANFETLYSDVNNDVITYNAWLMDDTLGKQDLPDWVLFDNTLPKFTFNVTYKCSGDYTFSIRANDGCSEFIDDEFQFTIVNQPITINEDANFPEQINANSNLPFSYDLPYPFFDPDNIQYLFEFEVLDLDNVKPDWLDLDPQTWILSSTNNGIDNLLAGCDKIIPLKITALNDCEQTAEILFDLMLVNTGPTSNDIQDINVDKSQTKSHFLDLTGYWSDINNDNLIYTAFEVIDGEEVALDSSWITFDAATPSFTCDFTNKCDAVHTFNVYGTEATCGEESMESFSITIVNSPPETNIPIQKEFTVNSHLPFSLQIENPFSDPDSDTLTYEMYDQNLRSRRGAKETLTAINSLSDNMEFDTESFILSTTNSGSDNAPVICDTSRQLFLKASDTCGESNTVEITVNFKNTAPTNTGLDDFTMTVLDQTQTLNMAGIFSDANGDDLEYTMSYEGTPIGEYSWINFDESIPSASFDVTEQCNENFLFKVTAEDECGATSDATFTLSTQNLKPEYHDIFVEQQAFSHEIWTYSVPEGSFSDPEGQDLDYTFTVLNKDQLGDELYYDWIEFNAETLMLSGDPPEICNIVLEIEITVEDNCGLTEIGTFNLTVTDSERPIPVIEELDTEHILPGESWEYYINPEWFISEDDKPLIFHAEHKDADDGVLLPDWLKYDEDNLRLYGTVPADTCIETWCLYIVATDPCENRATIDFSIATINNPPQVNMAIPNDITSGGVEWEYSFDAYTFTDYEDDTLSYFATIADAENSDLPEWMHFDPDFRTFSGMTPFEDCAIYNIPIRVFANDHCTENQVFADFELTIGNIKPEITCNGIEDQVTHQGHWFEFTIPEDAFVDADNDELYYHAVLSDINSLPNWITFENGTFTGIVPNQCFKVYEFLITAYDHCGDNISQKFKLIIDDPAPYVDNALGSMWLKSGRSWTFQIPEDHILDPFDEELTFDVRLVGASNERPLPSWLEFDYETMTFIGVPECDGTYEIAITATDACGQHITDIFTLTVSGCQNNSPDHWTNILSWCSAVGILSQFTTGSF